MRPKRLSAKGLFALGKAKCFGFAAAPASPEALHDRYLPVPNRLDEVRYEVALASRMLANEGVLDAFGHVSLRHPADPGRYLLARSRSPQLVEAADILEFTLDSAPVAPPKVQLFAERVIHGCILAA